MKVAGKKVHIVGIDIGFRNTGLSHGWYQDGVYEPKFIHLLTTEKAKTKTTRRSSDDLRNAFKLYDEMVYWIEERTDEPIIIAEIPQGSQSARGSFANGICLGLLGALSSRYPIIQVTASEAKVAAVGVKTATKEEMIQWAVDKYPDLDWIRTRGKLSPKNEHTADSLAIAHAGLSHEEFKTILKWKRL